MIKNLFVGLTTFVSSERPGFLGLDPGNGLFAPKDFEYPSPEKEAFEDPSRSLMEQTELRKSFEDEVTELRGTAVPTHDGSEKKRTTTITKSKKKKWEDEIEGEILNDNSRNPERDFRERSSHPDAQETRAVDPQPATQQITEQITDHEPLAMENLDFLKHELAIGNLAPIVNPFVDHFLTVRDLDVLDLAPNSPYRNLVVEAVAHYMVDKMSSSNRLAGTVASILVTNYIEECRQIARTQTEAIANLLMQFNIVTTNDLKLDQDVLTNVVDEKMILLENFLNLPKASAPQKRMVIVRMVTHYLLRSAGRNSARPEANWKVVKPNSILKKFLDIERGSPLTRESDFQHFQDPKPPQPFP